MSEETKVATETASEETTKETTNDSTDNSALIAESKKYRKRSQEAEARLAELESRLAKAEEDKLKEKEDFKALYEKVSSENESLTANSEKWAKYEEAKRASLIELHPEDDREALASLPLETLEYVTNKINNAKANVPEVAGNPRGLKEAPKDWTNMNMSELKDNWENILKSAEAKLKSKE
tara:strand:+ start:200 stop:739 length:540 start_codon:yes stop_codon:yes gene_type:complete